MFLSLSRTVISSCTVAHLDLLPQVNIRNKETFDGYYDSHNWYCYYGNCGYNIKSERGVTDRSSNAPQYNSQWCESETVSTRNIESDQPFQLRWAFLTQILMQLIIYLLID